MGRKKIYNGKTRHINIVLDEKDFTKIKAFLKNKDISLQKFFYEYIKIILK